MTSKADLIDHVRRELAARLARLEQAARDAHAAATDPDAQAESKYDTRSLESSYLASGQERQLEQLAEDLRHCEGFSFPDLDLDSPIIAGALVEVIEDDAPPAWFLLAPAGGGLELAFEDSPLTVLSPDSSLYGKLLGLRVGDSLESPDLMITEVR
jgi:hypothetical protein